MDGDRQQQQQQQQQQHAVNLLGLDSAAPGGFSNVVEFPGFEFDPNELVSAASTAVAVAVESEPALGVVGGGVYTLIEGPHGDGYLIAADAPSHPPSADLLSLNQALLANAQIDLLLKDTNVVDGQTVIDDIDTTLTTTEKKVVYEVVESAAAPPPPADDGGRIEKPIGKGPYPCPKCNREFPMWSALKRHRKDHEDDKRLRCVECPETFNLEKNLSLHLASHYSDNTICPECGKKFRRVASFKAHLAVHLEEDNLHCPTCDSEFVNERMLCNHRRTSRCRGVGGFGLGAAARASSSSASPFPFSCSLCSKAFGSSKQLQEHRLRHALACRLVKPKQRRRRRHHQNNPRPSFKNGCKYCEKSFKKPSQRDRHERVHTGEKPFKCGRCKSAFSQKSSLEIHLRKHTGEKPYTCAVCGMGFAQRGNLKAHVVRVHSVDEDEASFACDQCPCAFRKAGTLNAHVSKVHLRLRQKEDDLLSRAMRSTGLDGTVTTSVVVSDLDIASGKAVKHLVTVRLGGGGAAGADRLFMCNYCDRGFGKPSSLCRHLRLHRLEKPFSCKFCSRSFSVKSAMLAHSRIHQKREVACDGCDKRFASAAARNAHARLHRWRRGRRAAVEGGKELADPFVVTPQGILVPTAPRFKSVYRPTSKQLLERPYRCSSCTASFKKSSHLKAHQTRHTGEKAFQCSVCSNRFVTRSTLNAHMKTHDQRLPFRCSECGLEFTTAGSVRRHMSCHRQERPFVCPYCRKTFKTNVLCRKHIKHHHHHHGDENLPPPFPATVEQALVIAEAAPPPPPPPAPPVAAQIYAKISSDGTVVLQGLPELQATPEGAQLLLAKTDNNGQVEDAGTGSRRKSAAAAASSSDALKLSEEQQQEALSGNAKSLSERLLMESIADRNRRSVMKSLDEVVRERSSLPNKCKVCSRGFQKPSDLVRHMRVHTGERPFGCDTCGKRFSVKSTLRVHERLHKSGGGSSSNAAPGECAVTCHVCDAGFSCGSALKSHLRIHTGARPYVCPHCGDTFRTPGHRIAHISSAHKQPKREPQPPPPPQQEQQQLLLPLTVPSESLVQALETVSLAGEPLIGATVRLQLRGHPGLDSRVAHLEVDAQLLEQLNRGENIHVVVNVDDFRDGAGEPEEDASEAKEAAPAASNVVKGAGGSGGCCSVCGKAFPKPSQLERHMRIHTGERPFACSVCAKAFNQKNALQKHMLKHSGERPFVCPFCTYAFSQKGNLKTHIQRTHSHQAQQVIREAAAAKADAAAAK